MKYYLEIMEETNYTTIMYQPLIVRIEVESKSEAEQLFPNYENIFEGKSYIVRVHVCKHEEKLPCEVEVLKEVLLQ